MLRPCQAVIDVKHQRVFKAGDFSLFFLFAGNFESISFKADLVPLPAREIPPYNGFGSEEDSLATCLSLRPKPTRRDFKKFMEKDRYKQI